MKVFILAGEPSGDRLGAALMEALKVLAPGTEFRGIAGPQMQAAGMDSLFPMEELSVMGLAEVLPKYRALKRRIAQTAAAAMAWQPDVMITIDAPDFSLRVAKLVKAGSAIPTVHYVAPTVWAWRPRRAGKMARVIDHVMALFPFEPPYMQAAGMSCDFVGHPVVNDPVIQREETVSFRGDHKDPLVALLPGSRRSEIARLLPRLAQSVMALPGAKEVVLPTLPHLRTQIEDILSETDLVPRIVDGAGMDPATAAHQRRVAMAAADAALAASGTISLELASVGTPMVIAYDFNWITYQIIKRMLITDTVTLVNLVSETRTVPEFIGPDCLPSRITPALAEVLRAPDAQQAAMEATMQRLGRRQEAPGMRAARSVLAFLQPG